MVKKAKAPVVPSGMRPEEFMNDEALVAYRQRQLDEASDEDKADAQLALARAKRAAALTAENIAEATA